MAELHDWLADHHATSGSVWLVTYKKSVPGKYVSREEVLDELLCFGWIDGIRRKFDHPLLVNCVRARGQMVSLLSHSSGANQLV